MEYIKISKITIKKMIQKKRNKQKGKFESRLEILICGILIIVFVGAFIGIQTDSLIAYLLPFGISFLISGFIGELIEKITGDFFKNRYLSFPIKNFRINVPLVFILTFVIKLWLF